MYPVLKNFWALQCFRSGMNLVDRNSGQGIAEINREEALAVIMCDGTHTEEEIENRVKTLTGKEVDWERLVYAIDYHKEKCETELRQTDSFRRQMELIKKPWPYYQMRESSIMKATFVFTHMCNHLCTYCFQGEGHWKEDRLPVNDWLGFLDQFIEMGINSLELTGGEPAIHPAFWPVVEKASENGIYIRIRTNGTLWTEDEIEKLARLGVGQIYFSLPSADPETYDRVTRSKGHLAKALFNLKKFHDVGLPIWVKSVITTENGDTGDVRHLLEVCRDAEVQHVNLAPFDLTYIGGDCHLPTRAKREKLRSFCDEYREKAGVSFGFFGEQLFRWEGPKHINRCGGIKNSLIVLPDGTLTFCEPAAMDGLYCLANLRETSLSDFWYSDAPDIANIPGEYKGECVGCEHVKVCQSGCMFRSWLDSGELWGTDPRCFRSKSDFYHSREGK